MYEHNQKREKALCQDRNYRKLTDARRRLVQEELRFHSLREIETLAYADALIYWLHSMSPYNRNEWDNTVSEEQ